MLLIILCYITVGFREMFNKPNQRAFELVILFLAKCLKNEQLLSSYKGCYPCLDKNQEAQFRKITFQYLKSLEKVGEITLKVFKCSSF